jgi:hypothetical protein
MRGLFPGGRAGAAVITFACKLTVTLFKNILTGHRRVMGLYIETQMPPTSQKIPVLGVNICNGPLPSIFSFKNRGGIF